MGKKRREKKSEFEERNAPLLASVICGGAWGQIWGLPLTMQLLFPLIDSGSSWGKWSSLLIPTLGESRAVPCPLHEVLIAWSEGQGEGNGKGPRPLFIVPWLSYPAVSTSFPWAMLQSLCWVFKESSKGSGNGHASPESCQPLGLCLEQFGASSQTWKLSLCKGFQEIDWQSHPEKVLGEMQ